MKPLYTLKEFSEKINENVHTVKSRVRYHPLPAADHIGRKSYSPTRRWYLETLLKWDKSLKGK